MGADQTSEDRAYELLDILVHEVSDVDRAANKRRYLAIKQDLGVEVVEKEDGSLTIANREHTDMEDDKDMAGRKKQAVITLPRTVKQALMRTLGRALERLTNVVEMVRSAEETDEAPQNPTPDELAQAMQSVAGLLTAALERYPAPMVAKRGAKLSTRRRDQLKAVIGILQKILDEVMPVKSAPSGAMPAMRGLDPNRANAGAGVQPDLSMARDARQALSDAPGMRDVLKQVSELTEIVKRQSAELYRMRTAIGEPASRIVEKGLERRNPPTTPQSVAWPIDMNNELTRETVDKRVSFFELDEE